MSRPWPTRFEPLPLARAEDWPSMLVRDKRTGMHFFVQQFPVRLHGELAGWEILVAACDEHGDVGHRLAHFHTGDDDVDDASDVSIQGGLRELDRLLDSGYFNPVLGLLASHD